jgi:hypothetical protein
MGSLVDEVEATVFKAIALLLFATVIEVQINEGPLCYDQF